MKLLGKHLKAIGWYSKEHNYSLGLSVPPTQIFFRDKATAESVVVHLDTIMNEYNAWNEEDKKARAKERKRQKEQEKKQESTYV